MVGILVFIIILVGLGFKLEMLFYLLMLELFFLILVLFVGVYGVGVWYGFIMLSLAACEAVIGVGFLIYMKMLNLSLVYKGKDVSESLINIY
uniref:NADH dehydrogenase subunit 4L n=1 Tax=Microcosmus sulcatus TaxID=341086 RepID=D2YVH3_9ASCI|nr:NADH dehydrogenase subunit 4L [Microcosmus sulcatus]CAL23096.2 NADH dehydrogenase subunit 4L [Microcosmus sulcatus]